MTAHDPRLRRTRQAQRAALDHVLALTMRTSWADGLVLRGSATMLAWAGDRAREPGDLDWIAAPGAVPVHPLEPYPYVDGLDAVQQWPEADGGAAAYELFTDEDDAFQTGGLHPIVPPEGTNWVEQPDYADCVELTRELAELLEENPQPGRPQNSGTRHDLPQVRFDAWEYTFDATWAYEDYGFQEPGGGLRVRYPWSGEDGMSGEVQVDIALDEPLLEAPVHTLIPRGDGREPTLVRTASRELSLAWKLLWLHTDRARDDRGRGKDLFDAVLLAESPHTRLRLSLLRRVLRAKTGDDVGHLAPDRIPHWDVDWEAFRADHPQVRGGLDAWLGRLARALDPVFAAER